MNSPAIRNIGLIWIALLLFLVIRGIELGQPQENHTPEVTSEDRCSNLCSDLQDKAFAQTNLNASNNQRLTTEEIREIAITRKLPAWAKGSSHRKLSLEEIEDIVATGQLPK
ncbi:hypothetical protein [Cellvibrio sp.]|uniref:hypothetical protein n=1 Tax=Cellvibrio sp. TaxID=1965322 RepID=UPI0039648250